MEVHHHSSHKMGEKKNFKEYLLEFVMLFLAVTLGFFAENTREHIVENRRAKQFARSLLNDLKTDTAALKLAIVYGDRKVHGIDSFLAQMELAPAQWNDTLLYRYAGIAGRVRTFERNSGTYEQMKASGSLILFEQSLADLLNNYDVQAKKTVARENIGSKYVMDFYNPMQVQILDGRSLIQIQDGHIPTHPLVFRKTDKETIAVWINYAAIVQSTQQRTLVEYHIMMTLASEVINTLQKDYNLQ